MDLTILDIYGFITDDVIYAILIAMSFALLWKLFSKFFGK